MLNLTVVHHEQQQPPSPGSQPASDGPAVEDHGRVVTTTMQDAAFYRHALLAVYLAKTVTALRRAVNADPAFGLAVADLEAITQGAPSPISGYQMNWERHHIEVVRTCCRWQRPVAPPTYSVSTSPALAVTLSLDASSPTCDSASDIRLGPRTSAGTVPSCHRTW